ncbi:cobaltochelatase subunit CobN [Desulfospira joergensenii]|uniref:cobaltochelatase subunit CobN n=1 Tax=Desulfospira joergensenii TaxID=53329 RepID=UPI0004144188|nr:cobaltochelatase subunit CobN [Desulfospira joergensenii]
MKKIIFLCLASLLAAGMFIPAAQAGQTLTMLGGSSYSYKISRAFAQVRLDPAAADLDLYFFTEEDLEQKAVDAKIISRSKVIILDDMHRSLLEYVLSNVDFKKTKVFGLSTVDNNPDRIIADKAVKQYARPLTQKNLASLIRFIARREFKLNTTADAPQIVPTTGIFHPKSDRIFEDFDAYLTWYKKMGIFKEDGFWIGIPEMSIYVYPGEAGDVVIKLVEKLENAGMNVLPVFSYPASKAVEAFFYDDRAKKSRVDLVASLAFKFAPANVDHTRALMEKLNVPLLNPLRVHFLTVPQWRTDVQGLGPMEVSYAMSNPEFFGLIEPSLLGGKIAHVDQKTKKTLYTYEAVEENIDFFVNRSKAWLKLMSTPNRDKKIVIMFWNHTPGKQNIGATYLNLFSSIEKILKRLSDEGYHIKGPLPSEKDIQELILSTGRNIGSWASGELEEMISKGQVIRLPVEQYKKWLAGLDPQYRKEVETDWGPAEKSKVMVKNGEIIIPCVRLGNVILAPQPSRGWHDEPTKLYHSTKLWPHHQYSAFYLWLTHEFRADALISLGTHGSHEWLPGKQAGLGRSCSPEVLIQDLPNLYPYVMDNIGEGTQAKRRGRAVIIDYLIPAMKKAGVYEEYSELSDLMSGYNQTNTINPELAAKKFERIRVMVEKLGLLKDLNLTQFDENALEKVEHFLLEIGEAKLPYGLHTFGISPEGEALNDFADLLVERNEILTLLDVKKDLSLCSREIDHLINGLSGGYVPASEANDPIRNPQAIPTGNNFYGFNPAKVPSMDAWLLGKEQADQLIDKYKKEHGKFPEKIALVFWSIELQRNEGTQVATALHLMGMKPVWDKNGKVLGIETIPGKVLGRPRIDVHMQVSGLFRDNFPNLILLLDEAVQQAGQLKDVENFIASHNEKIKAYLVEKGYGEKQADRLKQLRVFSNEPGSYGNTIEDLIPASGTWENDEEIADVFINYVSFAYGKDIWGKPLKSAYKKNLEDVDMTMHTRSSNIFKSLDTDGVFSELGGLALAVKRVSGNYPDVVLSNQADPDAAFVEDIEKAIGRELRARYLNPKWIEGMKKENYAGAREMNRFAEHLWGWQVVTPFAVDGAKWEQIYEVYIKDKYGLELKEFFDRHNPWALQSLAARMLEADRKEYWKAPEEIKKDLAKTYALNVIEKGVACCEHTCNNPMLQKFVANIISLYGLLTPQELEQFQMTIAKAVGRTQEEHEGDHERMREALKDASQKNRQEEAVQAEDAPEKIKGYEMVEEKAEETKMTSSGASWMVMVIAVIFLGLISFGWKKRRF